MQHTRHQCSMTCTDFLQGHEWLAQHMSLNDQMATLKGPLQLGQALQRVETLLAAAGRTKPEWEQHWRTAWQQRLARCYDPRDALMCAASLEVSSIPGLYRGMTLL